MTGDFVAYLSNFPVIGAEMSVQPGGEFLRDRITLNVAGRELICTQLPAVVRSKPRAS